MATFYQNLQSLVGRQTSVHFDFNQFVRDHVTRAWYLTAWLLLLTYVTMRYTAGQLTAAPLTSGVILAVWAVTVGLVIVGNLTRRHSPAVRWLKNNLYNSITNVEITLLLVLAIVAAGRSFYHYAIVNASFETDPDVAATLGFTGANWGAVLANLRIFLVFRFPPEQAWRIWAVLVMLVVLAVPSFYVYRPGFQGRKAIRRGLTYIWLLTPVVSYVLLRGLGGEEGALGTINPDRFWGGLLLTVIISVFAIVVSFPLGLLLALGRRSRITGIPAWLIWGVAIVIAAWGLLTSTPENVSAARNTTELLLAYWPLLVLGLAYAFQRFFRGNVVAAFSTLYIEFVRGVPLITVLFMAIILFPIFLPPDVTIASTTRVLWGFALFSAAYLAENVRGGLQAITKGQYEAADSLGLNTFDKYRLIILPQALRAVIPAIVGQFIGLFKDTSLVAIVGLFDILGVANSIASQPQWLGVRREAYIFVAVLYYIGSAAMSNYSRRLEKRLGVGER